MEKLFYELIRVSVGQLDCLSRGPEPEEWYELYDMARQQNVAGVCYQGVQRLFEFGLRAPQDLVIDWMSAAEAIQDSNAGMNARTLKVLRMLTDRGWQAGVLAGQGVARDYGDLAAYRHPDTIDIFSTCGSEALRDFAKEVNDGVCRQNYRSVRLELWDDVIVRLHHAIGVGRNPFKRQHINQWMMKNEALLFTDTDEMARPSASLNVVLLLAEMYWHFLYRKLTMREMMDYFFTLKKVAAKGKKRANYEKVFHNLGLLRFSQAIMWVMLEVFQLELDALVTEPVEGNGTFVIDEMISGKRHLHRLLLKYPGEMLLSLL